MERSVILDNTVIGANAVVQNAIIDKDVVVPDGAQVGVDKDHDRAARIRRLRRRRDRRRQEPGGHQVSQPNRIPRRASHPRRRSGRCEQGRHNVRNDA